MLKLASYLLLGFLGIGLALPSQLDSNHGVQFTVDSAEAVQGDQDKLTAEDIVEAARYDPTRANVYHLFTRDNPSVSQPLLINSLGLLQMTNYQNNRRTVVLIHDTMESAGSDFNTVLIPAFLEAEDVNILVVDWSAGATSLNYRVVIQNTIASGIAVAQFIDWLNQQTHSSAVQYHIVGFGFGGHQAGIVGRNVQGNVAYVTGLNPAYIGWVNHIERFQPSDGLYTEVIHTNYGIHGYLADLAQVDFYPNGGISMAGCSTNACDHARSYFYFAESLSTGGFTGRQCLSYLVALVGACDLLPGRLQMGGLRPKIGFTGVYYLETNPAPPFSQG